MILNGEQTRHQSTTRIADLAGPASLCASQSMALECRGHKVPWWFAWTSDYPSSLVKIESEGFLLPPHILEQMLKVMSGVSAQ